MAFNVEKCKVMHIGHNNPERDYEMAGRILQKTKEERDIGVLMSDKLKPGPQCAKAARTATVVLNQLIRAFHFRDRHVFIQLYKQYVRPHLEFGGPAWAPWTAADKEVLEKVQRKAVTQVTGLKARDYEDRLKELGMVTLDERRHQTYMITVYKILTGKDDLDPTEWFTMAQDGQRATRSAADPLNVRVTHGRLDIRRNFFSVRVTEQWNQVPTDIKNKKTVEGFKKAYFRRRYHLTQPGV